ncbi:hypothetical protein V6N11_031616 [Hibiscus sabdariffa]|uniref:Uncharacterized protein n=1 Tax=Hibiscus sabdariffa TaxID=183260 RepID=A0ABR2SYU8_9ROSI
MDMANHTLPLIRFLPFIMVGNPYVSSKIDIVHDNHSCNEVEKEDSEYAEESNHQSLPNLENNAHDLLEREFSSCIYKGNGVDDCGS